jgi:CheY-like chemotaxis protein
MGLSMNRHTGANLDSRSWLGAAGLWLGQFLGGDRKPAFLSTSHQSSVAAALTALEIARLRILVADDDPKARRLASQVFAELGVAPMFAGDGAEAVALACGIEFDLVLMDPALRVLDGLAATREIRQFESERGRARVPVVVYTDGPLDGAHSLLETYGFDATLEKPCTAQALAQCLSSLASARLPLRSGGQGARRPGPSQGQRGSARPA